MASRVEKSNMIKADAISAMDDASHYYGRNADKAQLKRNVRTDTRRNR